MKLRFIPLFAVLAMAGCSKIHEERSFIVESGSTHSLNISAPVSQQTVKVALTSDEPVHVYVLLEKNVPGGKDDYDAEALKEGVLAKEKNTKDATLTATVPAKEKYLVYVVNFGAKKANVTVKVDSQ
jgi:hypothetical protein